MIPEVILAFVVGGVIGWLLHLFASSRTLSALQSRVDARDTELSEARAAGSKLQADFDAGMDARTNLEREHGELLARVGQLQGDLDTALKTRDTLQTERDTALETQATLEADLAAARQSKATLESELQTRGAELVNVQTELQAQAAERQTVTTDAAKLSAGVATSAATITALEGDKATLATQVADLESQLGKLDADLNSKLNAKDDEIANLSAQLEKANSDARMSLQLRSKLEEDVANLTAGATGATTTIKGLEADKVSLTAQVADLNARLDKLTADLDASVGAKLGADKQVTELQAQADKLRTEVNASADAHKVELTGLTGRLDDANAKVKAFLEQRTRLEDHLQARDAEMTRMRSDLEQHAAESKSLSAAVAKFTAESATATASLRQLQADNTSLTAVIGDLKGQLAKANADLQAMMDARAGAENELAGLKAHVAQLGEDADSSLKVHNAELATLRAQIEIANDQINAARQGRTKLEADLKARDAELERVRADLERQVTETRTLSAEVSKFTAGTGSDKAQPAREMDRSAHMGEPETLSVQAPPAPVPQIAVLSVQEQLARLRNRRADDETPFVMDAPQHLSDVKGIGSVFETRLYEAGVGTYWELAQLPKAQIVRILNMSELQSNRLDYDVMRADALRLARESHSLGRKWTGCPPDDFEPMTGIGHTFEKRLYDAGICTYEALAGTSPAVLEEICQAPARFKPDYAVWIEEAKALAAKKVKRSGNPL